MKRKIKFITLLFSLIFCMVLLIESVATAEKIRWRMATGRTPALTPFHEADLNLAKMITEMSGGRLEVTVYPAGELMPAFEIFDATRTGVIQMAALQRTTSLMASILSRTGTRFVF